MTWVQPKFLLRVESLVLTAALLVFYSRAGGSWGLFFAAILVPDLSMLGYAAGPRVGAAIYNLAHTYALPVILAMSGVRSTHAPAVYLAVIWLTHISVDRLLGLGLKYPTAFKDTHLNRV
jgi:Domain of unknown function (DUF4260)